MNGLFAFSQQLPYPRSTLIKDIEIDWPTHQRHAPGSDNFALTWADDGHLYGAWGDGGGFGSSNGKYRVSLGVARIEGDADNYRGINRYGHADNSEATATIKGKSWGMISVAGSLYMWVHPDQPGGWGNWGEIAKEARLHRSDDRGATWQAADWAFTKEDGLVGGNILQYGRDYTDSPDGLPLSLFCETQRHSRHRWPRQRTAQAGRRVFGPRAKGKTHAAASLRILRREAGRRARLDKGFATKESRFPGRKRRGNAHRHQLQSRLETLPAHDRTRVRGSAETWGCSKGRRPGDRGLRPLIFPSRRERSLAANGQPVYRPILSTGPFPRSG